MNKLIEKFILEWYDLADKLTEYGITDYGYVNEIETLCGSHYGLERYLILVKLIGNFEDEDPKTIVKLLAERYGLLKPDEL